MNASPYSPFKKFPELPDWTFTEKERSAMVYEVIGQDSSGNLVSGMATEENVDALIDRLRQEALAIDRAKGSNAGKP